MQGMSVRIRVILCLGFVQVLCAGCGIVGSIEGFNVQFDRLNNSIDYIRQHPDSLGGKLGAGLTKGVVDSLTSAESKRKIGETIGAVMEAMMDTATAKSPALMDSLLGPAFQKRLSQALGITDSQLTVIVGHLLGPKTRRNIAALRDTLLGDVLLSRMAALRDTLIGPVALGQLTAIADSVLLTAHRRYLSDIQPGLREDLGFVKKNAEGLLILIAALTAGIIAFVWFQKRRYQQMLQTVAFQIHTIPDRTQYDDLTNRIRLSAQERGLEPALRKALASQGILGEESWKRNKAV